MSLVGTLKALEAEKATLIARVTDLEKGMADAIAAHSEAVKAMHDEHAKAIADLTDKASAADAAAIAAKAEAVEAMSKRTEAEKAIADAQATIASLNAKLAIPAYRDAATDGQKPVDVGAPSDAGGADLWEQYHALKDPKAQREFYLAHKAQMSR